VRGCLVVVVVLLLSRSVSTPNTVQKGSLLFTRLGKSCLSTFSRGVVVVCMCARN
jgi:hypothetical protein